MIVVWWLFRGGYFMVVVLWCSLCDGFYIIVIV